MDRGVRIRLYERREVRRLTWAGRGVAILAVLLLLRLLAPPLYRGLASGRPLDGAEFLVVEGWLTDEDLAAALAADPGLPILVTGGPIESGGVLAPYPDYASFTAARLAAMGIPAERVAAVPAPRTRRDRTYNAALALRRHFEARGIARARVNLATRGVHARRSAMMYRRALGPGFEVGVCVLPEEFGPGDWWTTSNGFRTVLYETIAGLYTLASRVLAPGIPP